MASIGISNDLNAMSERLGRMVSGSSRNGDLVTPDDLGAGGASTALMKDAIKPNSTQT
ncbi:conserved unknown protein [Ectocarpus siliculosus]|uniref:Uncharacterized protein n=1 Tax=Ectocarpus siliculosus TaxID=2880 RepID=D8LKA5_ECTSI|nr:conserved unknown protein [Ectocarpus siliculosus]|eukprot:CBN76050.1 conserved unknown protein [Ectocarpus siliculosus]